jgi:hypothetical protein
MFKTTPPEEEFDHDPDFAAVLYVPVQDHWS